MADLNALTGLLGESKQVQPTAQSAAPTPTTSKLSVLNDTLVGGPTTAAGEGGFNAALMQSIAGSNPNLMAEAFEGFSLLTDEPELQNYAKGLRRIGQLGQQFKTKTQGWEEFFNQPFTVVSERAGEAVGSMLPSIAGGTVGGFIGSRVAGKYGALGGGIAGAGLPAYGLNYGDLYQALKAEGLKSEVAADWAMKGSIPITLLDVASPTSIVSRLTGAQRKQMVRGLAKRIAQEALKQAGIEAGTEAAQQAMQQGIVATAGNRPFTGDDARAVVDAFLSGGLGGGIFGGVTGVVPDSPDIGAPLSREQLERVFAGQGELPLAESPATPPPAAPPISEPPSAPPPVTPPPPVVPPPVVQPPVPEPPAEVPKGPPVAMPKVPLADTAPGPYYISNVDDSDGAPIGKVNVGFSSKNAADQNLALTGRRGARLWTVDRDKLAPGSWTSDLLHLPLNAADIRIKGTGIIGSAEAVALARNAAAMRNKVVREAQARGGAAPQDLNLAEADAMYAEAIAKGFRYRPTNRDASIIYVGPEPLTADQVREVGHVGEPSSPHNTPYGLYEGGAVPIFNSKVAKNTDRLFFINPDLVPVYARTMADQTLAQHLKAGTLTDVSFGAVPGTSPAQVAELQKQFAALKALTDWSSLTTAYNKFITEGGRIHPGAAPPRIVGDIPAYAMRPAAAPAVGPYARNRLGPHKWTTEVPPRNNDNLALRKPDFGPQKGQLYDWTKHKPGTVEAFFNDAQPNIPRAMQEKIARFTQLVISRVAPKARVILTFDYDLAFPWAYHTSGPNTFSALNFWQKFGGIEEMVGHELGHLIAHQSLSTAEPRIQSMVYAAWRRNQIVAAQGNYLEFLAHFAAPGRLLESLAHHKARLGKPAQVAIKESYLWDWPYSFDEWFAEQTARWFQTSEKPRTLVDKFFGSVASKMKQLYRLLAQHLGTDMDDPSMQASIRAEPEVEAFLNSVYERRKNNLMPTGLSALAEGETASQAANAEILGVPFDQAGPADSANYGINNLVNQGVGMTKKQVAKLDQYNYFIKKTWGLLQFAAKNPHIVGLSRYVELIRAWHNSKMQLISRAEGRLKAWRKLGKEMGQNLSNFLFAMDSMEYLVPGQNARWPTNAELIALAKKYNLNQDAAQLYMAIRGDFLNVLDRVEAAWRADAQRSISDPVALQAALASVTAEINQLRSKPYFPHERFGEWTLAVRDTNNKLVFFQQFQTKSAAVTAGEAAQKQYPSGFDVSTGRMPADVQMFRGIPPTLLKSMANKLQLTQPQRDWLDMLIFDLSPANSAAKKFKRRSNIAGYSYDGQQAYANYFIHMGSHIARLEYGQELQDSVKEVDESANFMRGVYAADAVHRRRGIAEWMQSTLDYTLNPQSEWEAVKAATFTYFLGFNVSSALINLTQIPMVAAPYLSARFNEIKTLNELRAASIDLRKMYTLKQGKLPQDELDAIALGVEQGFLDETQASELAAAARGAGRLGALAGNFVSRSFMQMGYWSSYMFSAVEKMNRRIVFRAAYRLAKKAPQTAYLNELRVANPKLYQEMLGKGWTPENAAAYLAGRDAVDRTQFEYARWNRPEFMRGKAGTFFAFWMFKQNILWYYKNSPGGTRALLVLLAAAGLMGLPGAEDMSAMVHYAMDKLGFRFNPKEEVRKFLVENMTDRRTADLLMHGLGRESLGMSWMGEMMGVPIPGFDVSSRLGMGEIVPGLQPMMQVGTEYDTKFRRTVESLVGASYSIPLRIAASMETGDPDVFKEWERSLPTAAKNLMGALRLATRGEETTRSGATVAEFDLLDAKSRMELLGKALGFTPTKMTRKWDLMSAQREAVAYWSMQRQDLFDSFDFARRIGDREAMAQVREDIQQFNAEVPDGRLRITLEALMRSARGRQTSRNAVERDTTVSKTYRGVARAIEGLYPEVEDASP